MAKNWPKSFDFEGFNEPIGVEWSRHDLEVEGTIPAEIQGDFFRATADPAHVPTVDRDTFLSGDGMVSRFRIDGNTVDFDLRYVQTARYQAEKAARKALFGAYHNPFTDHSSVADVDRTTSNTTPVWHAGRLLMTKEDGHPYEVDPETLETLGSYDFGGKLKSLTMSAHPRIDPKTGEMFFHGYEADGVTSKKVAYCIVDKAGNLVSEQWFDAPYCSMLHDFIVTEHYAIFPVFPTMPNLERMKAGGPAWTHHDDQPSWIGIMPRYGKVDEMKWIEGPKGISAFHMLGGWDDKSKGSSLVHMVLNVTDTNAFPFIRAASGMDPSPAEVRGDLVHWTLDADNLDAGYTSKQIGPPGDMSRIAACNQCAEFEYGYYACYDPRVGPPIIHSVVGAGFNTVVRVGLKTNEVTTLGLGPDRAINEPIHIPSTQAGHEGYLAAVVDTHSTMSSELWFLEASDIAKGAIAKVKLPFRLRPQVHGTWVPAEEVAKASQR